MTGFEQVPIEQVRLLQDFRANHAYKEVDVGDGRWRYLAGGQGDHALLFLPGGFLKADMWFYPVQALEDNYRFVVPDAFPLQDTFDQDDVCAALVQSLDAEGIERATVIGISAGGGVAQYLLQEHPGRVAHLVLSHCGIVEPAPGAEKRLKRLLLLVRLLPVVVIRRILLKQTTGHKPPTSHWLAFHDAYLREASAHISKAMFARFLQAGLETRRSFVFRPEVLDAWPGEVLLLASPDDAATFGSLGKLQARYPRTRTHVFEAGGHHTFMFFPEAYTAVLKAFLDEMYGR